MRKFPVLELRPIEKPEEFGPEWDVYGLFQNGEWLGFPETDSTNNYTFERLTCWEFLKKDEFKDRGNSDHKEYLLNESGKKFVVFLLSHDHIREQANIFIPDTIIRAE